MNTQERDRLISLAQSAGFDVYMRNAERDTWFYFTDGVNIGYCQFGDSPGLTTVHTPNPITGTGYQFRDSLWDVTEEDFIACAHCVRPAWAPSRDAVRKYSTWGAFIASSPFNAAYALVSEVGA